MTELSVDILPNFNLKTITVLDTSFYGEKIENLLLEVLPPTGKKFVTYQVLPKFNFTLNATNMGLCNGYDELPDLHDGIYELKLSYKPNFSTAITYYHFNQKTALNLYYKSAKNIFESKPYSLTRNYEINLDRLIKIKMLLDQSKYMVEYKHEVEKGKEMYETALDQLKSFENACRR